MEKIQIVFSIRWIILAIMLKLNRAIEVCITMFVIRFMLVLQQKIFMLRGIVMEI